MIEIQEERMNAESTTLKALIALAERLREGLMDAEAAGQYAKAIESLSVASAQFRAKD